MELRDDFLHERSSSNWTPLRPLDFVVCLQIIRKSVNSFCVGYIYKLPFFYIDLGIKPNNEYLVNLV